MKAKSRRRRPSAEVHLRQPAKALIPMMPGADNDSLLRMAHWLAASAPVLLLGIVPVAEGENLSAEAGPARELRDLIQVHTDRVHLRSLARVRVTYTPWEEIRERLDQERSLELLVLNWPGHFEALRLTAADLLARPPCDVAVIRGPLPEKPERILVPMRGGPHAERALRLGLSISRATGARVTSLQVRSEQMAEPAISAFSGMAQVLAELPEVEQRVLVTEDRAGSILEDSRKCDVVVLGTAAYPGDEPLSFGQTTDLLLEESPAAVIAVKTRREVPEEPADPRFGAQAISVLVDRWFAENTFHADEFSDLERLVALKQEQGLTISLALPTLNEEETIGAIIRGVKRSLMKAVPLVNEIVLMDSGSTDRTREIATRLGVPVFIHQKVLPRYGPRSGKGEALWKSLYVTGGDLVIWVDTDVSNFHPRFVYGLIGPLLHRPGVRFVKGFYRRPLRAGSELQPGRGGRVTELTARPLLNLFYPELSGIIQPLAGEYGGRREALEQLTFTSGYGVETSLLVDVFEKFKLAALAQVDLEERIHRNQPLSRLSQMSFAVTQALLGKLERRYGLEMLKDVNRTMKVVHYEPGRFYLEVAELAELERPPMIEIPEYRRKRRLPPLTDS